MFLLIQHVAIPPLKLIFRVADKFENSPEGNWLESM